MQIKKNLAFSGDSGVDTITLPRTHMIGDLFMVVKAQNGTDHNAVDAGVAQTIEEAITRIQVDSSIGKIKDYAGDVCRLVSMYYDGKVPPENWTQEGSTDALGGQGHPYSMFPMHFGLEPQDEDVILPAPLMTALDLIVDFDFTTSTTVGFTTGTFYMDVFAMVRAPLEAESMKQKNVLTTLHKQDYTTTGAGKKEFGLTTRRNNFLRRVYVQCYETGIREDIDITELELKVNSEQVWEMQWDMLQMINAMDCKLNYLRVLTTHSASTTDEIRTRVPNQKVVVGERGGADAGPTTIVGDKLHNLATDDTEGQAFIYSDVIPTMAIIDFDRNLVLANLQNQDVTSIDLYLEDAVSGGAVKTYEESLMRVPE